MNYILLNSHFTYWNNRGTKVSRLLIQVHTAVSIENLGTPDARVCGLTQHAMQSRSEPPEGHR